MSDSEESDQEIWIPFNERKEWDDVAPIYIVDGPDSICPIAYTVEFKETMAYLRAIMQAGEVSERAFELVGEAIKLNPANYTAWLYRIKIFQDLDLDVKKELAWISMIANDNPKNYQVWHQRQKIVDSLVKSNKIKEFDIELDKTTKDNLSMVSNSDTVSIDESLVLLTKNLGNEIAKNEIEFINSQISSDSKNFHAWSYRQYIIKTFELWDYEKVYLESKINQDIRNNSAWNQRYFVLLKGKMDFKITDTEVLEKEIRYTTEKIVLAPNNESSWVYIQGLLRVHSEELLYSMFYKTIHDFMENEDNKNRMESSRFYWSFMFKYYRYKASHINNASKSEQSMWTEKAQQVCTYLAESLDPIRKNYWVYMSTKC
ncbi:hypothetical protein BB559_004292 [Furculomyces boomerangus]|uniref:Protein farnesyltransferase/geranylgeranyltransferase type-1 subunit alpha n=2 Tax=Harpellales TaxID=61421 RepID=A0A2T9YFG2_9FUNG|nr:hypothetical protein BB559_005313 [Furculomyces boomerangus]PVU91081.1 hypothetical protein BB559_004292 [Furculomyces boomerangus]PVZ98917.1 hypothetical protein BB558_005053 [Smittium angustum]PWA02118.1 hypothetical protein BB558_001757 [Smittium angustum]